MLFYLLKDRLGELGQGFLETKSRPGFYKRIGRIVVTNRPVFINELAELCDESAGFYKRLADIWIVFEAMFLTIELTIGQNDKTDFWGQKL